MKIEQALIQYLIKFKQLPLQGIGLFELQGAVPDTLEGTKLPVIPEGAITFTPKQIYNEDDNLVKFVSEVTGKIIPLASADLDSYVTLGKQFLNLGNPFIIPGIGSLEKNNQGTIMFKPGLWIADKLENTKLEETIYDDKVAQEENPYHEIKQERKSKKAGKSVLIAISLLILAFVAWAVWRFAFISNEPEVISTTLPVANDTTNPENTSVIPPDSLTGLNGPANSSSTKGFRIIVNEYTSKDRATKRFNDLKKYGRNVVLYSKDSVNFLVAEEFDLPLSDTTRAQDSLKRYYGAGNRKVDF